MVSVHRPKERSKSEYQREFTWTPPATPPVPSPAPSPAPVAPSPIPQESFTACNTPEPVKSSFKSNMVNASTNNAIDYIGSKLSELNSRQPTLATSLDPQTKKIVALEANRLSKKSRSYSMYSLHDQLKVAEAANDLSSHFETEYKREFVNWREYGSSVREDTAANKNSQVIDHSLKRRGSWSAPSLPAPLRWLEGLNLDIGSREKLQPTITDAKSIRGITTKITAKPSLQRPSTSAEFRDYHYDDKRPNTSAEYREYQHDGKRPTNTTEYRDSYYDAKRPTTSADLRDYSRPMTSADLRDYRNDDYYGSQRDGKSTSRKDSNYSPLRSSTTMTYYDDREQSNSNRRDHDYSDVRKYSDRTREIVYEDRRRENEYDYRRREDNGYEEEYDSKYYSRPVQTSDQEHYHSRNLSYSSSNKGSVHEEPTSLSGTNPNLEALRHRSSVSSVSSVSTPSSPATPNGYDINDLRWRRSNGLDPRIYKEQYYSPSIASKSSSSSHNKRQSRDHKSMSPHNSALAYDGYGRKPQTYSTYSTRPPSRATSVSSHGTSIEEESAILTDMLKEADLMTLRNLTDQMNVFRHRDLDVGGVQKGVQKGTQKGVKNTGRSTPVVNTAKRSSIVAAGVKITGTTTTTTRGTKNVSTPGIPSNKKKGHRPTSSLASVSSISSTSSYREAYQDYSRPPPTNFSAAREALNRARMKVEEMLEIVSNGA
ncbi:1125_t:CDS:2 [Funneliformis geosporum]|uniref:1125_t:CDS:1 n=1 Tax=Funneliformis geosporum TaxID=1117311 RepID=A0A9W4SFW4_9GLOM|nr:1125_t:CDS:2 [Funneliformis geosporum]